MNIMDLNERPIAFHPAYARLTGSVKAGILLSFIMGEFANDKTSFRMSDAEVMKHTALSERELKTAKKIIKELTFIDVAVVGVPPVTEYRFVPEEYFRLLGVENAHKIDDSSNLDKTSELIWTKRPNWNFAESGENAHEIGIPSNLDKTSELSAPSKEKKEKKEERKRKEPKEKERRNKEKEKKERTARACAHAYTCTQESSIFLRSSTSPARPSLKQQFLSTHKSTFNAELLETLVDDFIKYRREIKRPIKTTRPLALYVNQLEAIRDEGYSIDEAIDLMKSNEWQTVKLEWVKRYLTKEGQGDWVWY